MSFAANCPLPILYRDQRLVVLNKPSGLLSVPGRGPDLQDCLSRRVQAEWPSACIVHRLDRDTSGLLLMALDPAAQRELSRQFAERIVEKQYVGVAFGIPLQPAGTIDLALRKDFDAPPRHRVDAVAGRPAQTNWRLIEPLGDRCRLALQPLTGRSHQLRVHLATIGHPLLGDNLYAPAAVRALAPRLLLHAERLSLLHPDDGRPMTWNSACPF